MTPNQAVAWFTEQFAAQQNSAKAAEMAAYMKHQFPFWGVQQPQRSRLSKTLFPLVKPILTPDWLQNTAWQLWQQPQREYQYAALDLLEAFRPQIFPHPLPKLEPLATHKSWWDTIDGLTMRVVSKLILDDATLLPTVDAYSTHSNFWLRRIAILHQLSYKQFTDVERLFDYCDVNADSEEFFIQKAIGWALREYAKTDAAAVLKFTQDNRERLSKLSLREALKHLSN
jgi:3-methyladenine DNA glycosylase AlkD